jgi:ATP-dependent Clp protease ATP-binding subunit ClpA
MIAQELEVSLHMAFVEARQKQHEFITVEHLLLAMLDNPSAADVLRACGVDLEELRHVLTDFIAEHTPRLSGHTGRIPSPRKDSSVIQRDFFSPVVGEESPVPTFSLRFSARIRTPSIS